MRSIISAITTRRHFVFKEERACGGQLFSECDTVGVGNLDTEWQKGYERVPCNTNI